MARDIKSTNYYKKKSRVSTKIETNSLVKECEEVNHALKLRHVQLKQTIPLGSFMLLVTTCKS